MTASLLWSAAMFTAVAMAGASSARGEEITLLFEPSEIGETGPVPVDGVSVSGVTFSFSEQGNPSMAGEYGAPGPGDLTYVDGDVLGGPAAGVVGLEFDDATPDLAFGVALNTIGTVADGFTVELFDEAGASLGTTGVETQSFESFSEGQFSHSGTPVGSATVSFDTQFSQIGGNREFALDNLVFSTPPLVPGLGPAGGLVLVAALGATAALRRRRHPDRTAEPRTRS